MKVLFCHQGLGDHILLSGAVILLAEKHGGLRIYCYRPYYVSVRSFYINHPLVQVVPFDNPPGATWGIPPEHLFAPINGEIIRSGAYAPGFGPRPGVSFPEVFYEQLGIPYEERWNSCPIEEAAKEFTNEQLSCEVFVHDDAQRGFNITRIISDDVYRPFGEPTLLRYVHPIRTAKVIHVIDSGFYHLIESLSGIAATLYLHQYAKYFLGDWTTYPRRHHWEILE
jgi:hypothetical protein